MSTARYVIGLLLLIAGPPAFAYWFVIHPFAKFWRRVGAPWAYAAGFSVMILLGWGLYQPREPVLAVDYGTNWALVALAAVFEGVAIYISLRRRKYLTQRILMGAPELSRDKTDSKLLDQGIYSRIRHPRYVEIVFAFAAFALFANYLGTYLVTAGLLPVLYLIILIEEKELRERFGQAYVDYSQRVPRFIPRRTRRA